MKLGKMNEIDIRKLWPHEQYDFSKWMADEENIKELGDTLNLSLTDIETEKLVGNYRCDIFCRDELTGKPVLIENQLEATNHDHLGKIITYASGLDASVIIWIVANAREEHISAIEWLNNHTDEDVSFFLIEIHAYQIGDSLPAPMFKIIEQPNDFSKATKAAMNNRSLNESETNYLNFWTMFNDVLEEKGKPFNKCKPMPHHWYSVAVGTSKCHISIDLINKEHRIRVCLWIPNDKDLYDSLSLRKAEIEQEFGYKLIWNRLDDKKASYFCIYIKGLDFKKQDNYKELMETVINHTVKLRNAVTTYL